MGYRIEYQTVRKLHRQYRCRTSRGALTGAFFFLFLVLTGCFWTDGREVLWGMLFPGDREATLEALAELSRQLVSGVEVREAFAQFCGTILEGCWGAVY